MTQNQLKSTDSTASMELGLSVLLRSSIVALIFEARMFIGFLFVWKGSTITEIIIIKPYLQDVL